MPNIWKLGESDTKTTLEGECSLPVFLTDPDGITYTTNTDGAGLSGQVLYAYTRFDTTTGEPVITNLPVVSLRISTLTRVPLSSEKWQVQIPIVPDPDAVKKTFLINTDRSDEKVDSLGFMKLFLQEVDQV